MRKGDRTKSLRRLTRTELESSQTGGLVDDSVPEGVIDGILERFGVDVDRDALKAYLRGRISLYRSLIEDRKAQLSAGQESKLLAEAMEYVRELRMRLSHLPEQASTNLDLISWKRHGETFHAYHRRLDTTLQETWAMLAMAERAIDDAPSSAGAKPKIDRDWLLSDVAEWLTANGADTGATQLYALTFSLCQSLGADVPDTAAVDPEEIGKIIRGWRKRQADKREK